MLSCMTHTNLRILPKFYVDYLKQNPNLGEEPVDIEDLVNIGKTSGPYVFSTALYPFFLSSEMVDYSDFCFKPCLLISGVLII